MNANQNTYRLRMMQKIGCIDAICLSSAIALLAAFLDSVHAAPPTNLAPDASFELEESQQNPIGWHFLGRSGGDAQVAEGFYPQNNVPANFIAHGGMRSAKISGKDPAGLAACVMPQQKLEFSCVSRTGVLYLLIWSGMRPS